MKHDSKNIDDLFRTRLANKKMKVENPNFSFKSKLDSNIGNLASQSSTTKLFLFLKANKLVFIIVSVTIVGTAYYFNKNYSEEQDISFPTETQNPKETPIESIQRDFIVTEDTLTIKSTDIKRTTHSTENRIKEEPSSRIQEKSCIVTDTIQEVENTISSNQDGGTPENVVPPITNTIPDKNIAKDDSLLEQSSSSSSILDSITNNRIMEPIKMKEDSITDDNLDNENKKRRRKKREMKKLR